VASHSGLMLAGVIGIYSLCGEKRGLAVEREAQVAITSSSHNGVCVSS
jgi:hypothetical protein